MFVFSSAFRSGGKVRHWLLDSYVRAINQETVELNAQRANADQKWCSSYLNNFLGRFHFRHFGGVSLNDVQNSVSVSVDEVSSSSSIDDLVLSFAGVDGVPHVVFSNVLNVDRSRLLLVVVFRVVVVILLLERPRTTSEAGRGVGSDSFVEAAEKINICSINCP